MCYEPQLKKQQKNLPALYLAALDPQLLYFKFPSIFQRELHYRSLCQETECHSLDFLICECNELSCPRSPPLASFLQFRGGCLFPPLKGRGSSASSLFTLEFPQSSYHLTHCSPPPSTCCSVLSLTHQRALGTKEREEWLLQMALGEQLPHTVRLTF